MSTQSVESFACSSYQTALQGTAGHCFLLLKWVLGNLVRWLMWPATAVGAVPVDMLECLLWPCRQVLGPGDEPIVKCGQAKPDQPDLLLHACMYTYTLVHTHCTLSTHTNTHTHTGTWIPLGQGELKFDLWTFIMKAFKQSLVWVRVGGEWVWVSVGGGECGWVQVGGEWMWVSVGGCW